MRVPFKEVYCGAWCDLKDAVEMAGLVWHGRAHCGLDDATNTAHLLALLIRKGFKFSITNSLVLTQPTDHSLNDQLHKHKDLHMHNPLSQFNHPFCYCGVKSSKAMVRKPGPKQGNFFYGCGRWTAATGAHCRYFEWISP